jgi:hypothetical protein
MTNAGVTDSRVVSERRRLQNRRSCESFDIQVANLSYKVSIGRFPSGELAEVFISNHRSNSSADVAARDCGILMSLLLQHGCDARTIAHSLSRNTDSSASGVAAAVLDKILGDDA